MSNSIIPVEILQKIVAFDFEVNPSTNELIAVGAIRHARPPLELSGKGHPVQWLGNLGKYSENAKFVLGHNIVFHDLPWLAEFDPNNYLLTLNPIDTLILAPLAFPNHPYHRLWKGYKTISQSRNNPGKDAEEALVFFEDICKRFSTKIKLLTTLVHILEESKAGKGSAIALREIFNLKQLTKSELASNIKSECHNKCCDKAINEFVSNLGSQNTNWLEFAFFLAWLPHSEGFSRPAPWVINQFPSFTNLLNKFRGISCNNCDFCLDMHSTKGNLKQFFGFDDFRMVTDNLSQQDIIEKTINKENLLVLLSTGGGKSLCFQLPALMLARSKKSFTIIISPLQSLMKDQVDALVSKGIQNVGTINGLQNSLERAETIQDILLGKIDILFVAPEQLRNKSFSKIIKHRILELVIVDEAHCLSQWGHDFRPDYLFLDGFLKEVTGNNKPLPTIACYTATARLDVVNDIKKYFVDSIKANLTLIKGGLERSNLQYYVNFVKKAEKLERIKSLIFDTIIRDDAYIGSAIVFTSTRKNAENFANDLKQLGINAQYFHGGCQPEKKREVQENFLNGITPVICATNAFGMGVDKSNVRLVIHANVPDSLENYLQEAGRAGRDGNRAECYLLYDTEDLDMRFDLLGISKISATDMIGIYRNLKNLAKKSNFKKDIVKTAKEILRIDESETETFNSFDENSDTKVKIGIAWLEKIKKIERTWNKTYVVEAKPIMNSLEESKDKIRHLNLPKTTENFWMRLLAALHFSSSSEMLETDNLVAHLGRDAEEIIATLKQLKKAGLIKHELQFTAFINKLKSKNDSVNRWNRFVYLEKLFLKVVKDKAEIIPDEWTSFSPRHLLQYMRDKLKQMQKKWPIDRSDLIHCLYALEMDKSISFFSKTPERIFIRFQCQMDQIEKISAERRKITWTILSKLYHLNNDVGKDLKIDFGMSILEAELLQNHRTNEDKSYNLIKTALLLLHRIDSIVLQNGFAIFRPAMTLKLISRNQPTAEECNPLSDFYDQKIIQMKVMDMYAHTSKSDKESTQELVKDYFSINCEEFNDKYFKGKKERLKNPISEKNYLKIIGKKIEDSKINDSDNIELTKEQRQIITDSARKNQLILAGPGSGKTKVLVHRAAYLASVLQVHSGGILVVAFNRATVIEIRKRLKKLIGRNSRKIRVFTYHGLALRITDRALTPESHANSNKEFSLTMNNIIQEAVQTLKELKGNARDEVTGGLIGKLKHILVDEYQDINQLQYDMISLLARKDEPAAENKISLLAVGDDDQNIYEWNGSNNRFLRKYETDYAPNKYCLTINFRSIPFIVSYCNQFILKSKSRMKQNIEMISFMGRGPSLGDVPPQIISPAPTSNSELLTIDCVQSQVNSGTLLSEIAVLTRTNSSLLRILSMLKALNIPANLLRKPSIPIIKTREVFNFLEMLDKLPKDSINQLSTKEIFVDSRNFNAATDNPWEILLNEIISVFIDDLKGKTPDEFKNFLYDTAREYRLGEKSVEKGCVLATMHSAKGLEFDNVIVVTDGLNTTDEHRRLVYVAMTRARKLLTVIGSNEKSKLWRELASINGVMQVSHSPIINDSIPKTPIDIWEFSLSDVILSFPSNSTNANKTRAFIKSHVHFGTQGELVSKNDRWHITVNKTTVSILSKSACERVNKLRKGKKLIILSCSCHAVIHRTKKESQDKYLKNLHLDDWEIPLFKIEFANES